jgi:DivIVA domain-containing protein
MALTPEDVVNKRFQPTKFREGYDQDEVDDFLDEVVVELRRLSQENEELRQRLIAGESRGGEQASAPQPAPVAEVERVQPQFVAAPVAAAPAPVSYPSSDQDAIDSGSTNNLLQLARKLHEEHVREGIEKRDALIAEGHATAARVVSEAEAAQRAQISTLEQEKSALEQEKSAVEREKTAVEREKTAIEQQIDELRTFEREYRQKLKSYIEGQLRDLDAAEGQSAEPGASFESVSAAGSSSAPPASFQGFGGN